MTRRSDYSKNGTNPLDETIGGFSSDSCALYKFTYVLTIKSKDSDTNKLTDTVVDNALQSYTGR